MGSSFKMKKGGSSKDQAVQVGVLMIILGLVAAVFVHEYAGGALILIGIIVAIGGKFASE